MKYITTDKHPTQKEGIIYEYVEDAGAYLSDMGDHGDNLPIGPELMQIWLEKGYVVVIP